MKAPTAPRNPNSDRENVNRSLQFKISFVRISMDIGSAKIRKAAVSTENWYIALSDIKMGNLIFVI